MKSRKRKAEDSGETERKASRVQTTEIASPVYARPPASKLTPYAHQFEPSDYELFNQVLSSADVSVPRIRKSGLTPRDIPLNGPLLTPIDHATYQELGDYQRNELSFWTALELVDLEVIEATPIKPSNLSNEIHPVLDKPRWRNTPGTDLVSTYHLLDGTPIDINDPEVWSHLVPSLKLASQFIANFNVFEWWDALWLGRREQFTHPDGPREPKLTRFFRRSGEERLKKPVRLEKYLHSITWEIGIGKLAGVGWEGLSCGPPDGPMTSVISISGIIFEPLLLKGVKQLSAAQRLAQNFYIASTILHELAHSVGYIRNDDYAKRPPEIGSITEDPPTTRTRFDRTPEKVEELIKYDCYKGEETEQQAHRAFRKRWTGIAYSEHSKEELEELLRSKNYWNVIRHLRSLRWFAATGSNVYNFIKKEWQRGQHTEEWITCELHDRLLAVEGVLDDQMTGNDFITAILVLRQEEFFAKSKMFREQYYMDEDVSEHGFSMTASVFGGHLNNNTRAPRDYLHHSAIKRAWRGFTSDLPDIDEEVGQQRPKTFFNLFICDYPIYRPGYDRLYDRTPILNPQKFHNPANEYQNWPIPLSYIEEIQQDDFWKISCLKWGGEMMRVNPRIYSRKLDREGAGTTVQINLALEDFLNEPEDNSTPENKHRSLKRKHTLRIATQFVRRLDQDRRQSREVGPARITAEKKARLELFLAGRASEKIAFYGNLVTHMHKEMEKAKELEEQMARINI